MICGVYSIRLYEVSPSKMLLQVDIEVMSIETNLIGMAVPGGSQVYSKHNYSPHLCGGYNLDIPENIDCISLYFSGNTIMESRRNYFASRQIIFENLH